MNLNPVPKIKSFFSNAKYISSTIYRPDVDAFTRTLKVVLIGIIVLGVLGFIISFVINQVILATP